jgi:hypothetical protein
MSEEQTETEQQKTPAHKTPQRIAYMQAYWLKNKEAIIAKQKAKRQANLDAAREYGRQQYQKNREKILKKKKEAREAKKQQG